MNSGTRRTQWLIGKWPDSGALLAARRAWKGDSIFGTASWQESWAVGSQPGQFKQRSPQLVSVVWWLCLAVASSLHPKGKPEAPGPLALFPFQHKHPQVFPGSGTVCVG